MATDQEAIKFYLPTDEAQQLKAIAARDARTLTAILRRLVRNYLADPSAAFEETPQ